MVRGRGLWSSLGGGCCVWAELRLPGPPEPIEWRACWSVDWGQVTGKNRRTDFNRGRDRDVVEPQGQLRRDVFLRADVSCNLSLDHGATYDFCRVTLVFDIREGEIDGTEIGALTVALIAD